MKYQIEIELLRECGAEFVAAMAYHHSGAKRDVVRFERGRIVIEAERKHRCTEEDVFMNLQHSLYNQLVKVLLVHYCQAGSRAGIRRITVSEVKGTGPVALFGRAFSAGNERNYPQPFCAFDGPVGFDVEALKGVLGEDDDSYRLRIVLLHWLSQGMYVGDRQRTLESVWRTFERLCEYHLHEALDKRFIVATGLSAMISEVMSHSLCYPRTCAAVAGETVESLRKLRWQEMIENNYPKTKPGSNMLKNYREYEANLITPFVDERVVALMQEVLVYRRSELQRYGLYNNVEAALRGKVALRQRRDVDVVAVLCQYIYFLRNRLFHGQLTMRVSIFDDLNSDNMRLDFLNNMLETLCQELINNRTRI